MENKFLKIEILRKSKCCSMKNCDRNRNSSVTRRKQLGVKIKLKLKYRGIDNLHIKKSVNKMRNLQHQYSLKTCKLIAGLR